MEDRTALGIAAMLCISVLEGIALYLGVDGAVLSMAVAAIAGIAGYEIKAMKG